MLSSSFARAVAFFRGTPALLRTNSRLPITFSESNRLNSWNTKPTVRRRISAKSRSLRPVMSGPCTMTRPSVGRRRPPAIANSVDFPEPEGPITITTSRCSTERDTERNAWVGFVFSPKTWLTSESSSTALFPLPLTLLFTTPFKSVFTLPPKDDGRIDCTHAARRHDGRTDRHDERRQQHEQNVERLHEHDELRDDLVDEAAEYQRDQRAKHESQAAGDQRLPEHQLVQVHVVEADRLHDAELACPLDGRRIDREARDG